MKLTLIMGIQGSGKSTLSQSLQKKLGFVHISTGDLLRTHIKDETKFGNMYKAAYARGEMAPDEMLYGIIYHALSGYLSDETIILDGFPRNMKQVKWLESNYNVIGCVFIKIPIPIATKRLLSRKRDDDTKESIKKRFSLYKEHTKPVVTYYKSNKKLVTIKGDQPPDDMFKEAVDKMGDLFVI